MVNPSSRVALDDVFVTVTTVPAPLPSRMVALVFQLRWASAVSVPANPPNNATPSFIVICSRYTPAATHTWSVGAARFTPCCTLVNAVGQDSPSPEPAALQLT